MKIARRAIYFFLPLVAFPLAAGAGLEEATLLARVEEAEASLLPLPFLMLSSALF